MTDITVDVAASLQQKLEAERQRVAQLEALLQRLMHPEDLGHAVSNEVRGLVRDALKR